MAGKRLAAIRPARLKVLPKLGFRLPGRDPSDAGPWPNLEPVTKGRGPSRAAGGTLRPAGRLTGCRRRQREGCHKGKRCHGDVTGGRDVRRGDGKVRGGRGRAGTWAERGERNGVVRGRIGAVDRPWDQEDAREWSTR